MLERFSRCCCGRCDACSGQNPPEMLLVVPSTWTQAPYGACDAAKCNGFAGTFVLDIYGADACFYKGPVDTDTDRCMWTGYQAQWWYEARWIHTQVDVNTLHYVLRIELYGNAGFGPGLFARWEKDFGATRPPCSVSNLTVPMTWYSAYFCVSPAVTVSA